LTKVTPVFGEAKLPFDKITPYYAKNFPVMFLDDIEIHWIHETSKEELLEKLNTLAFLRISKFNASVSTTWS
jgi:uncharacterized protein (DUF1919 family)